MIPRIKTETKRKKNVSSTVYELKVWDSDECRYCSWLCTILVWLEMVS